MPTFVNEYKLSDLPNAVPLFPLQGVLLLPKGLLPLHIFEKHFLAMIEDSLRADRLIGMVQPKNNNDSRANKGLLYETACVGKITGFEETEDGRYYITLTGVCRFHIKKELPLLNGYRRALPDWKGFKDDLSQVEVALGLDRIKMRPLLEHYFDINGLSCEWESIEQVSDEKLITCLSMICPLADVEKQALLEANENKDRAELFMAMLEMAVKQGSGPSCHERKSH